MVNKIFESVAAALTDVKDGATVLVGGFGNAGMPHELIDGLIDMVWRELGYETDVIATGSDAAAIAALSQRVARTDEHLTLRGLSMLHTLNRR